MAAAPAPRVRSGKRTSSLRARVRQLWSVEVPLSEAQERQMAGEYAFAMGWHLPVDDQVRALKQQTEGAPTVRRGLRTAH